MGTDKVVVERISTSRRWRPNQQYGLVVIKNMPSPKGSVMFKTHNTCLLPVTYRLWVLSVEALKYTTDAVGSKWTWNVFYVTRKDLKTIFSPLLNTTLAAEGVIESSLIWETCWPVMWCVMSCQFWLLWLSIVLGMLMLPVHPVTFSYQSLLMSFHLV